VLTTTDTICWAMIAHAPPSIMATATPATAPQSRPIMGSISTRLKSMSRSIRHWNGDPMALSTKVPASTWSSGLADGSP
jgi:hypothetical protein